MPRWCNEYQCWYNEAELITENMGGCDYECTSCPESEEIKQNC